MTRRGVYEGILLLTIAIVCAGFLFQEPPGTVGRFMAVTFFMQLALLGLYQRDYAASSKIAEWLYSWGKATPLGQLSRSQLLEGWLQLLLTPLLLAGIFVVHYMQHSAIPIWMWPAAIACIVWVKLIDLALRWGLTLER